MATNHLDDGALAKRSGVTGIVRTAMGPDVAGADRALAISKLTAGAGLAGTGVAEFIVHFPGLAATIGSDSLPAVIAAGAGATAVGLHAAGVVTANDMNQRLASIWHSSRDGYGKDEYNGYMARYARNETDARRTMGVAKGVLGSAAGLSTLAFAVTEIAPAIALGHPSGAAITTFRDLAEVCGTLAIAAAVGERGWARRVVAREGRALQE